MEQARQAGNEEDPGTQFVINKAISDPEGGLVSERGGSEEKDPETVHYW
jgi:hypothetical protein